MTNSFRRAIYVIMLMLLGSTFVNTAQARAIDCSKVKAPTDYAVCSNQDLREADVRLNQAYQAALAAVGGKSSPKGRKIYRSQTSWLKQRNFAWEKPKGACYQDVSCLTLMYEERIQALQAN